MIVPSDNVGQRVKETKGFGTWTRLTTKTRLQIPTAMQSGEILAHAFGTCHCPTSLPQAKAKAKAKPTSPTNKRVYHIDKDLFHNTTFETKL